MTKTPTRERLIRAAMELFFEKGYGASGMAEILQRAEVNSGSFYHFYRSKDDLLAAVLDRYQDMLHPVLLQPIWQGTEDPIERIFALLGKYRELILACNYTYGCPIGRLAMEVDAAQSPIHKKIAANFTAWKAAVEACLEDAKAKRRIPGTVASEPLACLVLSVMEGGVMQSRSYGDVAPFDLSVAELRRYFTVIQSQKTHPKKSPSKRKSSRRT